MISLKDESLLTHHFLWHVSAFERSVHGAMVERLILDSSGSVSCRVCGGVGVLRDDASVARHRIAKKSTESWIRWSLKKLNGVLVDKLEPEWHAVGVGSVCQCCDGSGTIADKRPARTKCPECSRRSTERYEVNGKWRTRFTETRSEWKLRRASCPECYGMGELWVEAKPTSEIFGESAREPDSRVLERYARMSRRLARMRSVHRETLERYYGVHGQSWAGTAHGRIHGLLEFTASGKKLLARTKRKGDEASGATRAERLAAQADLQRSNPEKWRRELLDAAAREAGEALKEAVAAWSPDVPDVEPGWREAFDELGDAIDATGELYDQWLRRNPDCWELDAVVVSDQCGYLMEAVI